MLFQIKHKARIGQYEFSTDERVFEGTPRQICPAGAEFNPEKVSSLDEILRTTEVYEAEEKFDGERLLLHFCPEGIWATTRRVSDKTGLFSEKINNIPHIRELWSLVVSEYPDTVLDGEIIVKGDKTLSLTQSVMNSNPRKAIQLQKERGWATFECFDCLVFRGQDVRDLPLTKRRNYANRIVDFVHSLHPEMEEYFKISKCYPTYHYRELFEDITARGGEGIVLKKMDSTYGENHSWLKVKRQEFVDAFVTGWEKGQGRNSDVCGYLNFSVKDENGQNVEIARVGALSDVLRLQIATDFKQFEGRVAELKMQEVTENLRLRHPRINRWRPDKGSLDCTIDAVRSLQKFQE